MEKKGWRTNRRLLKEDFKEKRELYRVTQSLTWDYNGLHSGHLVDLI